MTATEAARSFSEVLNRVAAGEEVEVTRSGAPVAVISPPKARLISADRFRELMASAPHPDDDFADDLGAVRQSAGPPGEPWAFLIDTDLLIDLKRAGGSGEAERLLGHEERAISVITVSELLHGVLRASGAARARRRAFVEHVLVGLEPIPITEVVARVHADIWADLSERGEPIGAHDLWIAATALARGLGVATRNASHFDRIRSLRVLAPI